MRVGILLFLYATLARADEAVDLSALGLSSFTPYINERNSWWILLPVLALLIVMSHLPFFWNKKSKKNSKL